MIKLVYVVVVVVVVALEVVASSSLARIRGECSTVLPRPRFFSLPKVEISSRTLVPLFLGKDQSTVAQQTEMTVPTCSLTSCMRDHFQIGSHTMPDSVIVNPFPLCWVKGVCVFRCNLPPALLAE